VCRKLPNETLNDWIDYLYQLNPKEIDLGLARVEKVAWPLGLKQFHCPVITVTGTNGKGSVVCLLESIFSAAGFNVASYTSPHFLKFNERIRYQQCDITDDDLLASFNAIEQRRGEVALTFFEFTTLCALWYFQQVKPDVIILEVGLGGRLDAVNLVDSDIAVITSIALDHQDWLGESREQVALEKVGITRANKPLVCGEIDFPMAAIEYCQQQATPIDQLNARYFYHCDEDGWDWQGVNRDFQQLPLPPLKLQNAATALMVVERLMERLPVKEMAIQKGLVAARLMGRFEYLDQHSIVLDVAHNPAAAQWLADNLQARHPGGKKYAVFAALNDKDIDGIIGPLKGIVDHWYVASLDTSRGASAETICKILAANQIERWYNFSAVAKAFAQALEQYDPKQDLIVVFGSFHTVAQVKMYWQQNRTRGAVEWISN